MSCTVEELQAAEYEILCKFADFCEDNKLKYNLTYGTLLGAVRHNGFIPWDDDVDVCMSYKDFKKFLKLYKKNPIDGIHLSWFDCEKQYPLHIAKLRKENTYMPESDYEGLDMHNGVWIDIFMYLGEPESSFKIKFQSALLSLFRMCGEKFQNEVKKRKGDFSYRNSRRYIIIEKIPGKCINFIRKILFMLMRIADCRKSSKIRAFGFEIHKDTCLQRDFMEPSVKHAFGDREFYIPENHNGFLTRLYGKDYMTPIVSHIHSDLNKIELDKK